MLQGDTIKLYVSNDKVKDVSDTGSHKLFVERVVGTKVSATNFKDNGNWLINLNNANLQSYARLVLTEKTIFK